MDTLKAYEKLRSKFDDDTAKALVETLTEFVSPSLDKLATKDDLAHLAQATKDDLAHLAQVTKDDLAYLAQATKDDLAYLAQVIKDDLAHLAQTTKENLARLERSMATKDELTIVKAELRTEIQAAKVETIRWMVGIGITIVGILIAVLIRLH
jgi:hypothetical protein